VVCIGFCQWHMTRMFWCIVRGGVGARRRRVTRAAGDRHLFPDHRHFAACVSLTRFTFITIAYDLTL